jgi:hypothetical protein
MDSAEFLAKVFPDTTVAFANRRLLSNKPREPKTLMFRTISASHPLLTLLKSAGVSEERCFDAVVLSKAVYLLGMLFGPAHALGSQSSVCSVFLCALADAGANNPNKGLHLRLTFQRDESDVDLFRVSLHVNQSIHAFATAAANEQAVLEPGGLSPAEVEAVLGIHQVAFVEQLRAQLSHVRTNRKRLSEESLLKETGERSEFFLATQKQQQRAAAKGDPIHSTLSFTRQRRITKAAKKTRKVHKEADLRDSEVAPHPTAVARPPLPQQTSAVVADNPLRLVRPIPGFQIFSGLVQVNAEGRGIVHLPVQFNLPPQSGE